MTTRYQKVFYSGKMGAFLLVLVMFGSLILVSCQSRLSRDAQHLRPGMTKNEVAKHFSRYGVLYSGTGDVAVLRIASCTKLFQTNSSCAYRVTYINKKPSLFDFENCAVFFDAKDVIIGFKYELPD